MSHTSIKVIRTCGKLSDRRTERDLSLSFKLHQNKSNHTPFANKITNLLLQGSIGWTRFRRSESGLILKTISAVRLYQVMNLKY